MGAASQLATRSQTPSSRPKAPRRRAQAGPQWRITSPLASRNRPTNQDALANERPGQAARKRAALPPNPIALPITPIRDRPFVVLCRTVAPHRPLEVLQLEGPLQSGRWFFW